MADETKTETPDVAPIGLLNDARIGEAANELMQIMDEHMGKLKLGQFPDGSLHPASVIQTLVSLKGGMIQTQHQNLLCLAALETLADLLTEEQKEQFVTGVVAKLNDSRQSVGEAAKAAAKKPIIAEAPRPSGIIKPSGR